jgi:hypothetical protein
VLAAIYNPKHPPFFNAYMRGKPHKDLRFFVRARVGAIPQLDSPEEVALINCDGAEMDDGIWYSQHLASEVKANKASSLEDRRLFATHAYNIETVIAKNDHLYSRAAITFEPLVPGERVMKFGLLPTLRVSRVTDETGQDLHYIQESRKEDGSFYAILDEAPEAGKEHSISVEYVGDKVLSNAGDGSYYVGARESWYPNLNGFGEKALYDLTFKVPPSNVVISVGKLEGQSTEAGFAVSHWVTPVPVAVAGFNYGRYKKIDYPDTITHYNISGYYLEDLPDALRPFQDTALSGMAPSAMTKYALDQARPDAAMHPLFRKGALRHREHHRTAELQLRPIVAEPGLFADFGVHRLDAAMAAVRHDRHQIYGLRQGSDAPRGGASVVRPRCGMGLLSRPVALRRFCGICRGIISGTSRGPEVAEGLPGFLGAPAPPHSR